MKYWSNSCGDPHRFGQEDITENKLPEELKHLYKKYWEENKDGHFTYLMQFKGVNGIAIVEEYYEMDEGKPCAHNYKKAVEAASIMAENKDCTVVLAKQLGFPSADGKASELVIFMPATISRHRFDQISRQFSEVG